MAPVAPLFHPPPSYADAAGSPLHQRGGAPHPEFGRLSLGLQFGLQFTVVQYHPGRIGQGHWSRLNQPERPRPELLMRLGALVGILA
jgi:hypothetical protein